MAPLPRRDGDGGTGVPVHFPRQIIDTPGKGQPGLGQAQDAQRLALNAATGPAATGCVWRDCRLHRGGKTPITIAVGIDDGTRPAATLSPEFGRISEAECTPPPVKRRFARVRPGGGEQRRGRARHRDDGATRRGGVGAPHQPTGLGKARPHRNIAGFRTVETAEIRLAKHGIFRRQPIIFKRKYIGWQQPVGDPQPTPPIGRAIIGDDQIKIQHQAIEAFLAQA